MKSNHRKLLFPLLALMGLIGLTNYALAGVTLPHVLGSHMVLERDVAVPIWGTAAPGEKVAVSFRDQKRSATADRQGKWLVRLDPLKAGGPDPLKIAGANTITLEDVLVGEVWVGSGQSNMSLPVSYASTELKDAVLTAAAAKEYPRLRLFTSGAPGWQEATPQNIRNFSALLFAFGSRLQQDLDMPVGLLAGAVGATWSGPWLSQEAYRGDEACQKAAPGVPPLVPGGGEKIGCLYEPLIRPLIPYAIRGVLWDQGEGGTGIRGVDQYALMGALIRGWRKDWGQGDFPFLYVQKPSGGGCAFDPADTVTCRADKFAPLPAKMPGNEEGALARETYLRIMRYPNTAMVTSSDLGGGTHPLNKFGYGARAARVALGMVYGRKVEIYGPIYRSHKIESDKIRVSFTHAGQGLTYRHGGALQGFAIAGEDRIFHWAMAAIDGDTVVVSSPDVPKPLAVRYAWSKAYPWANLVNAHPWANFFNKDGLPALPFRTDSWALPRLIDGVSSAHEKQ